MSVYAQNFSIGARGGISIPNLSASGRDQNPVNTGYSSREGVDGGIYGEYRFSELFSVEVMVEFCGQGGQKNGVQAFPPPQQLSDALPPGPTPPYFYATYDSKAKLNYLMLPILAKFGWNFSKKSPFRVYVDAGPFLGYLLSAHQITSGTSRIYYDAAETQPIKIQNGSSTSTLGPQDFDVITDIKDQLHAINLGIEGNVGISYRFGRNSIFIEGGGDYGFLNIQKGTANGKNNTGAATGTVGYSYALAAKSKHNKKG